MSKQETETEDLPPFIMRYPLLVDRTYSPPRGYRIAATLPLGVVEIAVIAQDRMFDDAKDARFTANLFAASPLLARACFMLAQAYQEGEDNGGSMRWEDVDAAWLMAKKALTEAGIPLPVPAEPEDPA